MTSNKNNKKKGKAKKGGFGLSVLLFARFGLQNQTGFGEELSRGVTRQRLTAIKTTTTTTTTNDINTHKIISNKKMKYVEINKAEEQT